jgi:hypothetical protein
MARLNDFQEISCDLHSADDHDRNLLLRNEFHDFIFIIIIFPETPESRQTKYLKLFFSGWEWIQKVSGQRYGRNCVFTVKDRLRSVNSAEKVDNRGKLFFWTLTGKRWRHSRTFRPEQSQLFSRLQTDKNANFGYQTTTTKPHTKFVNRHSKFIWFLSKGKDST